MTGWLPRITWGGACQCETEGDYEGRYLRLVVGSWSVELTGARLAAEYRKKKQQ